MTGVQCQHNHRPAGNFKFVAATDRVNESRTPSGTAPGARAGPVKPCPAFTLSGGPAPSRVGEVCKYAVYVETHELWRLGAQSPVIYL